MAQSATDQKANDARASWKDGSIVEVYSSSADKWYKGEIVRTFTDAEGEWLEVKYDAGDDIRLKQMSRTEEETIRPFIPKPHKPDSIAINDKENEDNNTSKTEPKTGAEASVVGKDTNKKRGIAIVRTLGFGLKDKQNKSRKDQKLAPSPRSSNWKEIEFTEDHYGKPVIIDSHQMLIASGDMNSNVYRYDFIKNKLKVYFQYPEKLEPTQVSTCIDHNKQKIYLYCNYSASKENNFMEYDIKTTTFVTYNKDLKDVGAFPVLCCLSGNIHLIGGRLNNLHLIWDDLDKVFSERALFVRSKMIHGHGVIPLEGSKQILVMGGNDSHLWGGYLGGIWLCDTVPSIKWKYLENVAMPHKMSNFGYIKTKNERHIIIFGGKTKTGLKDEIWILNLITFEWTKSDIKCPKKGKFYAVKSRDGHVHLFEIDTKHYWDIKLSIIMGVMGQTKHIRSSSLADAAIIRKIAKTFKFANNANAVNAVDNGDDEKEMDNNVSDGPGPDWQHKVIELHNKNMKLKKQLKHSKERIDALIQQNVKLNKDMRKMDNEHQKEIQRLENELNNKNSSK